MLVFAVLFAVFLVLYKVLPNRKATFKSQLPGAFMIAVAWMIFSYGFSLYFEFFPNFGNMYGSLTALIMVMLTLRLTEGRPCGIVLKDRKAVKVFIEDHFLTEKGSHRL